MKAIKSPTVHCLEDLEILMRSKDSKPGQRFGKSKKEQRMKQDKDHFSIISIHGGVIETREVDMPESVGVQEESQVPEFFYVFLSTMLGNYEASMIVENLQKQARSNPQLTAALYQMEWNKTKNYLVNVAMNESIQAQTMQVHDAIMLSYFDTEYKPKTTRFQRQVVSPSISETFPESVITNQKESKTKMNQSTQTVLPSSTPVVVLTLEQIDTHLQSLDKAAMTGDDIQVLTAGTDVLKALQKEATFEYASMMQLYGFLRTHLGEMKQFILSAPVLPAVKQPLLTSVKIENIATSVIIEKAQQAVQEQTAEAQVMNIWSGFDKTISALTGNASNVVELPKTFDAEYFSKKATPKEKSIFSNPLIRNVSIGLSVVVVAGAGVGLYMYNKSGTLIPGEVVGG